MTKTFFARNHDPKVKAEAQAYAREMANKTRRDWAVGYTDDYNDYSVSGRYVVFQMETEAAR